MTRSILKFVTALVVPALLAACGSSKGDYTQRIADAENTPSEWLTYGGGYEEQRFSRLGSITPANVNRLGIAWDYQFAKQRGVEATPLVVDGVMYVTSAWSVVYALDAKTGEELWVYDPEVSGEDATKGCCDVVNRGVAVYGGKVFVGVFDGRLEALNARTGKVVWSTQTVDTSKPYTITGAPRVANGKVFIGNGGAELGVRGYVSAYDVDTGNLEWRFYTVPNPDKKPDGAASDKAFAELGNSSWGDEGVWTEEGGGGTVWDSIVYDEANNAIVFGVGNGSPWNPNTRDPDGGDNLFLSSIVSVDADTGEYRWHFQTTPREAWDYTATQPIMIADLPVAADGKTRRVVMQAPKNGFFYVLDAATGDFISGEPFAPINWATGLDEKGRPIENPQARSTDEGFLAIPGPAGAHNWHPMAFNPDTGLVYLSAQVVPALYMQLPNAARPNSHWNIDYNFFAESVPEYPAGAMDQVRKNLRGFLLAWDPVKQEARWSVEQETPAGGGVLATKSGLVFQGTQTGKFGAYDAGSGKLLWSQQLYSAVAAPPVTYEIEGEQYVAVGVGAGGSWGVSNGQFWPGTVSREFGRVVVFKLGANGAVPEREMPASERTPKTAAFGTASQLRTGFEKYAENCLVCHGAMGLSSGVLPDLRWSPVTADAATWKMIVNEGALLDNGMPDFGERLSQEEVEAIRAYLVGQAWMAVENGEAKRPEGK